MAVCAQEFHDTQRASAGDGEAADEQRALPKVTVLLRALVVMAALAAMPAAYAQRADLRPAALSALDYFEIRQLYARYCHGLDSAADGGYMFANVFTADGLLIGDGGAHEGTEQLAAFARTDPEGKKGPTNVRHFLANVAVEPTPSGASGRSDVLVAAAPAPGQPRGTIIGGGEYRDDLVRTSEGWRIRRRVLQRAGAAAPSPLPREAARPAEPPGVSPGRAPVLRLTAEDYADIHQLYAQYGFTYDSGADNGYAWAGLYTEDGIHVATANPLEFIRGRDLLAAFAFGAYRLTGGFATLNRAQPPTKNPLSIAHIQTSLLLQPTSNGVVAKIYRMTGAVAADGTVTLTPGGVYFDHLVKTAGGWRYRESWYMLANTRVADGTRRFTEPTSPLPAGDATPAATPRLSPLTAADHADIHQLYALAAHVSDNAAGSSEFVWQVRVEGRSAVAAEGKAYVVRMAMGPAGTPVAITAGGQYWDSLEKGSQGWRIARRTFHKTPPAGTPPPVTAAPR
jgi:hypothetical protein